MSKVTELKQPPTRIRGVTFTHGDCNNRVLHGALEKLDEYTGFDAADLSRWNKIKNAYDTKTKDVSKMFKKLVDKHAHQDPVTKVDKDGNETPVLKPNGKPAMRPRMIPTGRGKQDFDWKDRKAFNDDYRVLMDETFTIEAYRLLTEDLRKAGLTPKEIRACAKIISDIDPELVSNSPIFEEGDEEEAEELDRDAEDSPGPIPGSSVDQAPEAPNEDAGASPS